MASVWVRRDKRRKTFTVGYREGGRDTPSLHGGSFTEEWLAQTRAQAIRQELAALRSPALAIAKVDGTAAPTVADAWDAWLASRDDVTEGTRTKLTNEGFMVKRHRLGSLRVNKVEMEDVAAWVKDYSATHKRETIRKVKGALALVLEHAGVSKHDNPARDGRVKLPAAEDKALTPPGADVVEAVFHGLPAKHREAFLVLEWSGARLQLIDTATEADYDPERKRLRARNKGRGFYWIEDLPAWLTESLDARLPDAPFRSAERPLFPDVNGAALRTAMNKAATKAGVARFSPHDLRHRRISLMHAHGETWARIGAFVGQRNISVTADTYTHVMMDEREIDHAALLMGAEAKAVAL
jgi:integrase